MSCLGVDAADWAGWRLRKAGGCDRFLKADADVARWLTLPLWASPLQQAGVHVDWLFVSEPSAAGRTTESSAPIAVVQLLSRVGLLATPKLNFFKNWSQSSQTLLLLYQLSSCNILKFWFPFQHYSQHLHWSWFRLKKPLSLLIHEKQLLIH